MLKYKRSFFRLSYLICIFIILLVGISVYRKNLIYDKLTISYDNKEVKYGNKVTAQDIVKTSNAPYRIIQDIDPTKLGEQEILVEVVKEDVSKIIPINVVVVDETKPEISLNDEDINVFVGNSYDIKDNIKSVIDDDINLEYKENPKDEDREYYTVKGDVDYNTPGTYEVEVIAVDRANNITSVKYNIIVKNKEQEIINNRIDTGSFGSAPINGSGGDLVSIAYSLVGSPYISGSNGPYGFDCSGFVQYVYSRVGKYVSRSSYTQAYDGVGVSYANAQPGDILNWGHGGAVTHSALYVGNGMMIHATNPSQGVIVSSVAGWQSGSIDNLMGVRRVN